MNKILISIFFCILIYSSQGASFEASEPFCKNGDVYVSYSFYDCPECGFDKRLSDCINGCSNGQCLQCDVEECDKRDGYYKSPFCSDNSVFREYRNYECSTGICDYKKSEKKVEECFFGVCSNGVCEKCNIMECESQDGYYGSPFCSFNTSKKVFRDYTCSGSKCIFTEKEMTLEKCSDRCEDGICVHCNPEQCDKEDSFTGKVFCEGGNLHQKFNDYSCSGTKCDFMEKTKLVERCIFGCAEDKCIDACNSEKCDENDGYVGKRFCKNGNVYRTYKDYSCSNIACSSQDTEKRVELCEFGCSNGECTGKTEAKSCPNSCQDGVWKYDGILRNNKCQYQEQVDCNSLDGEYGARFCRDKKTFIEYRDYTCSVVGCQFTIEEKKVSETCDTEFDPAKEKIKYFEFNVDSLKNSSIEKTLESVSVFNGILFSKEYLSIEAEEPGELAFFVFETNNIAPLKIKLNGQLIAEKKFPRGLHTLPVEKKGTITLETESSGLVFWTPSIYRFATVTYSYQKPMYEGELVFNLKENEYLKFISGSLEPMAADIKINSKKVENTIDRSHVHIGENNVKAVSKNPLKISLEIHYIE